MSPKKERGKQRKAAKDLATANGTINISRTVRLIRKGDNKTTINISSCSTTHTLEESNGILYEQSGILSTVLKFLKRCEDDTFVKVMLDVGGDLKTPRSWVQVLMKAEVQEPSCRLLIAQSIGPLARCMYNDTKREFFKSNKHWRDTIPGFVSLIHNMILHSAKTNCSKGKEIIDTLLNYEGLLTSIVHLGFWNENRPDIANELNNNDCTAISKLGLPTLNRLMTTFDLKSEEGRKRVKKIGATPIINKEYDPDCTISFVVGLIRQVKIDGWTVDISKSLRLLLCTSGCSCVDKDVITELIDLGYDTSDDKWVVNVAILLRYMILKEYANGRFYSNDTRVAFAIRGGLIEQCLIFIERFGLLESFDKKREGLESLFVTIKKILTSIYYIQLNKKAAKAIRSKRFSIELGLVMLEGDELITINPKCKKLLDMTRSILDTNGSYCCRCNKSLSKTEVKQCNGCGLMSYCSRACQKDDWLNGHNVTCCKTYTIEKVGQFQGRSMPIIMPKNERAAATLKELEFNLNMIQLKLFLDHKESILSTVEALDIPLYDCVAEFDLRHHPLLVKVKKYTDYDYPELKRGFECSRSKKNITCIYYSFIHNGSLVEGRAPTLKMQRLFPHEWLSKQNTKELEINKDDSQCVLS